MITFHFVAWATDASQQSKVLVMVTLVHTSNESSQAHCFKQMIANKRFQTTEPNQQAEVLVPVALIVSTSEPLHSHVGVRALENMERVFVSLYQFQFKPSLFCSISKQDGCTSRFGRKRRPFFMTRRSMSGCNATMPQRTCRSSYF